MAKDLQPPPLMRCSSTQPSWTTVPSLLFPKEPATLAASPKDLANRLVNRLMRDMQKLGLVQPALRTPTAHSALTRVTAACFGLLPSTCLPAPIHHCSLPGPPSPAHSCYHQQEPERTWHLQEESKCRRSESLSSVLALKCDLYAWAAYKAF